MRFIRSISIALSLLATPWMAALAQHKAAPPAPAASAASAPAHRGPGDAVAQIAASEILQHAARVRLPTARQWAALAGRTDAAEQAFAGLPVPEGSAAPDRLVGLSHDLWAVNAEVAEIVHSVATLVRHVERDQAALEQDATLLRDGLDLLGRSQVPAAVVDAVQAAQGRGEQLAGELRQARDRGLLQLVRAQALQARIRAAMDRVTARIDTVMTQRGQVETLPIWRLALGSGTIGLRERLAGSASLIGGYLAREGAQVALLFGSVLLACLWLYTRPVPAGAHPARSAYGRPLAAALLLGLVAVWFHAPNPPVLLYSLLLLLLPLPVTLLLRRAAAPPVPATVTGVGVATAIMGLRSIVDAAPVLDRLLLLAQIGCIALPLLLDLRRGRLQQAFPRYSAETVRALALLLLLAGAVSAAHAVFGVGGSLRTVRVTAASLVAFGLILGTAAVLLYGAVLALLATPLLAWLRSARQADPALLRVLRAGLALGAVFATLVSTLGALALIPEALATLDSIAESDVDIGAVTITAGDLALALSIVVGTLLLAAAVRFILEREVLPRLQLRPGAGYAIATFTRWLILISGGVLTLAALGVDATRITLLAGAVGVGIGFGLQTVINNFVSGLILIVERPVAVGDLIEIGPLLGEIQRIGIRSSSVRTTHGAEVIVPNSDLASKEVINWTRSDRQRRYDIDVGVAYGSDPAIVMRLLEEAAREVPEVIAEPAPMAMFKGYGDSALEFRLLAWVSTIDLGIQAQTELRLAVLRKLEGAGIGIPYQQRMLHPAPPPPAA